MIAKTAGRANLTGFRHRRFNIVRLYCGLSRKRPERRAARSIDLMSRVVPSIHDERKNESNPLSPA